MDMPHAIYFAGALVGAGLLFGLAALGAAAELHGDMTQAARLASLDAFRKVCLNMPDDAARFLSRAYILRLS